MSTRVFSPTPSNGRLKAPIRFTCSSMKNAQGLKFLYNFFNIPFLFLQVCPFVCPHMIGFLQRETLENSLDANLRDIQVAEDELDCYDGNGDPNASPRCVHFSFLF